MKHIPIGTIVVVEAPGSRGEEGGAREIPAIVIGQWRDSTLQLYCFHFEGAPILLNSVSLDRVRMVGQHQPVEAAKALAAAAEPKYQ